MAAILVVQEDDVGCKCNQGEAGDGHEDEQNTEWAARVIFGSSGGGAGSRGEGLQEQGSVVYRVLGLLDARVSGDRSQGSHASDDPHEWILG